MYIIWVHSCSIFIFFGHKHAVFSLNKHKNWFVPFKNIAILKTLTCFFYNVFYVHIMRYRKHNITIKNDFQTTKRQYSQHRMYSTPSKERNFVFSYVPTILRTGQFCSPSQEIKHLVLLWAMTDHSLGERTTATQQCFHLEFRMNVEHTAFLMSRLFLKIARVKIQVNVFQIIAI